MKLALITFSEKFLIKFLLKTTKESPINSD